MGDNDSSGEAQEPNQPRQEEAPRRESWIRRNSTAIRTTLLVPLIVGLTVLAVEKTYDAFTDNDDAEKGSTTTQRAPATGTARDDVPTSTASASATTSATASPDDVRWSGTINLTYLDLDSAPPRVLPDNGGASAWVSYDRKSSGGFSEATLYGLGGGFFTTKPTIALWTTAAEPTRRQCSDLIATRGAETLPVTKDSAYCVKTAAGRTAFIAGVSLDKAVDAYTASVTVWSATD
ncbi:hypothetical protein [Nocardia asiatica]|uniref:hypothetical protein n=1 Tax=Nocardia asiatica TaxID=209252 RepID=UPI0024552734|nr:hypothetical protein [Nocardia asiatica]